jgi:hypothetical protein
MGDIFFYAVLAVPELLEVARAKAAVVKAEKAAVKAAVVKVAAVKVVVVKAEKAAVKAAVVKVQPCLHQSGPVVYGT